MNRKKSFEVNEEILNKIISVAYGDAGPWDKFFINRLAKKNTGVKILLESYKSTAKEIHSFSLEDCPKEILAAVERQTTATRKRTGTFGVDFLTIIYTRPVFSAAVTIILVGFIVFGIIENRVPQYQYSKAEIELADKQTKQALAIVGKIFDQTNETLRKEVLNSRVAKPIRESMGIVNNLFTSENELRKGEIK